MDIKNIEELRPYLNLLNKDQAETLRGQVTEVKGTRVSVKMSPTIAMHFELTEVVVLKKGSDVLIDPVKGTLFATDEKGELVEVQTVKPTRGCTTGDREQLRGQF